MNAKIFAEIAQYIRRRVESLRRQLKTEGQKTDTTRFLKGPGYPTPAAELRCFAVYKDWSGECKAAITKLRLV